MPIPSMSDLAQITTPEELDQAYEKYGWAKTLTFNWVIFDSVRKVWSCVRYTVDASKITCGCKESVSLVVKAPTGIISTCKACGVTTGPISFDDRAFSVISVSRVTKIEAQRMLKESNQIPPIGADSRMKVQSRYERFKGIIQ